MGTFHSDKGALHGITVVVRTTGNAVYVGRCDTQTPHGIYLNDADRHEDGHEGKSIDEYLAQAKQWGHWPKLQGVEIPTAEITSVQRMSEIN